ncbi:protein kinase [Streptomyces albus subsp. albus]|nr:protein kinase [Streptomyces albus subsp. albus]
MTNFGGRADEPTSFGLQPPQAPDTAEPYAAQHGDGRSDAGRPDSAQPYPPTQVASTASGRDLEVGRLVGGRYRLLARLGHGGMGTVWRAHDQVVDREVAVKEPRVPAGLTERDAHTVYQRMRREARAAARISHPSVVTVHDVVIEDGRPWIVMELVKGESLADRLSEGTLDPREVARIGLDVLGALAAAHAAGVLHRDVKPDNVLLGSSGVAQPDGAGPERVVLTDFGIAQVEGEQGLTQTGSVIGSPEFIAPERVLGQRPGPESDLWSLGVVLYTAVEGMSPFRRSHAPATLHAILSGEPQTPARGSGALATLIMQLLRKDPAARPSAAEARRVLESVVNPPQPAATMLATRLHPGGAPEAAGSTGSRFVPPILHRNRKAQLGLGGGVLVVAAAVALAVLQPFADKGAVPSGWTVREDPELVAASIAVPKGYERVVDDERTDDGDGTTVSYNDPSGVFTISVSRNPRDGDNEVEDAKDAADQLADWYTSDDNTDMQGSRVVRRSTTRHQGQAAVDMTTTYGTSSDEIRYAVRDLLVVNKKKTEWEVSVTMPAKGAARADGDRLFQEIRKHLKIEEI